MKGLRKEVHQSPLCPNHTTTEAPRYNPVWARTINQRIQEEYMDNGIKATLIVCLGVGIVLAMA